MSYFKTFENFSSKKEIKEYFFFFSNNMTKEKAKEMFEYLDEHGEHELVKKYKGEVEDNIISAIIGAWATSTKSLEEIVDEYWERHKKIYKIEEKQGLSEDKEEYVFSSGDAVSTNSLTHLAGLSKDEEDFLKGVDEGLLQYSGKMDETDIAYLKDFYTRYKEINK